MKQYRTFLSAGLLAIGLGGLLVHGQPPRKNTAARKPAAAKPRPAATPKPADPAEEKTRFDAAIAAATATEKAELLVKFIADYPKSTNLQRAQESLAGARAALADERLTSGDVDGAVKLFRLAVDEAPKPYGDRLFGSVISTIPANLFWRGHRAAALDIASAIEANIAENANQLLILSTFYLETENGIDAKRLAEAAVKLGETNSAAHQALASAHRLNFDLEQAAASFAKAVELDPEATTAKRSLADMKRALGKSEEAEALYREILAKNEKDLQARTGLVLSLFESGKRTDAEGELAKSLEENFGNVVLLAGAAYWYAANGDGGKAVEYANRAIAKEPRFIWSHIAMGRGLMLQKKPVEAEQALLAARKYGNFPTLQYEIASARLAAGFFQEAAEELKKSFTVENGVVKTRLGGRVERSGESFADVIAFERRASIFAPAAAEATGGGERLKALLELDQKLAAETKDDAEIASVAERFAAGDDNMAVHRQLYAANLLLQKGVAGERAFELARSATAKIDASLDVANPGAAVMASELYEARNVSFARDDYLLIPDVPRQTLIALMRGRVEETTGLALLKQGKPDEATVRFRRALTVFPKDSAWWRSATWNLGTSLAAQGSEKEGLDAMISSYKADKPHVGRYLVIESLYRKVNGNLDGFEEKVGPNPLPNFTSGAQAPIETKSSAETAAAPPGEPEPKKAENTETKLPTALPAESAANPETSPSPEPSPVQLTTPQTEKSPIPESKKTEPSPSPSVVPPPETAASPEPKTETKAEIQNIKSETPLEPTPAKTEAEQKSEEIPKPSPEVSPSPEQKDDPVKTEPKPTPKVVENTEEPRTEKPEPAKTEEKPEQKPAANEQPPVKPPVETEPKTEPPPENKPAALEVKNESVVPRSTNQSTTTASTTKPLFDPIIISVGKEAKAPEREVKPEPKPVRKAAEVVISDGLSRPRIVDGKPVTLEAENCTIGVSQDSFSLIRDGGNAAILVSIDIGRDATTISATSSSPADVEVRTEPDVIAIPSRSLYVIKSVSRKTGMYQVSFVASCGKKDVTVRVR